MGMSFTPDEFLAALAEDNFKQPVVLTGMVKKADDPDSVMFASGTLCQNWVKIPLKTMVERVERLGKVPCRDHTHELVRLYLKQPEGPEAGVLAALLRGTEDYATGAFGLSPAVARTELAAPFFRAGLGTAGFFPSESAADLGEGMGAGGVSPGATRHLASPIAQFQASPGDEPFPNLLRFPASTFDICTPSYGRWCGNCRTSSPDTPPVDEVDAACKAHDTCIDANGHQCDCDASFIATLTSLLGSSHINGRARAYAAGAITAFQAKPCFCYKKVLGRKIKVWGLGGRCPF
jgi:hypothetical protein